ncbi:hypothetical protein Taro_039700 [Colocasia esculenta]|uniref:Uncharacterized protein n=1 Tax=Colocasia esculenta TaxID=4460 RepID=A0A843WMZ9_COLES|nr:hypothetical protein [Colocasia esculenta]
MATDALGYIRWNIRHSPAAAAVAVAGDTVAGRAGTVTAAVAAVASAAVASAAVAVASDPASLLVRESEGIQGHEGYEDIGQRFGQRSILGSLGSVGFPRCKTILGWRDLRVLALILGRILTLRRRLSIVVPWLLRLLGSTYWALGITDCTYLFVGLDSLGDRTLGFLGITGFRGLEYGVYRRVSELGLNKAGSAIQLVHGGNVIHGQDGSVGVISLWRGRRTGLTPNDEGRLNRGWKYGRSGLGHIFKEPDRQGMSLGQVVPSRNELKCFGVAKGGVHSHARVAHTMGAMGTTGPVNRNVRTVTRTYGGSRKILEAITTLRCCEDFSLERLGLLGDFALKFDIRDFSKNEEKPQVLHSDCHFLLPHICHDCFIPKIDRCLNYLNKRWIFFNKYLFVSNMHNIV